MKQSVLFTFFILLFFQSTFGCSFVQKLISKFDKTEYVFIGEVVGYTEPVEFKYKNQALYAGKDWFRGNYKQSDGLIVKVKESVYLPKIPKTHFEVFDLTTDGGCTTLGFSKIDLKKRFPVNSEILVAVKEASIFPHVLEDGNFRLQKNSAETNFIGLNTDKNNKRLTDVNSIFDYSRLPEAFSFEENYYLFSFEAKKDLLRLQQSKTRKEKEEIIDRLLQNPTLGIDYFELLGANTKDQQEFLRLYERRLRFENEFFSKQFNRKFYSEEDIQKLLNEARKKPQSNNNRRKNKYK